MERLYSKFSKFDFWLCEVPFLGHLVNQNGILVKPTKIEVVMRWEVLNYPYEIQSFLVWQDIISDSFDTSPRLFFLTLS